MLLKILSVIALLVLILVVVVALQPSSYSVTRSAVIAASADQVFPFLNDFHRWDAWSPWAKLDPEMEVTFEGPEQGVGATYHWLGNSKVGQGSMHITESSPSEKVVIDLHFIKPLESRSVTTFTLEPQGERTRVTWNMAGENNFLGKAFGLFMNMDKMIGKDFERGLADLETAAIASASERPAVQ